MGAAVGVGAAISTSVAGEVAKLQVVDRERLSGLQAVTLHRLLGSRPDDLFDEDCDAGAAPTGTDATSRQSTASIITSRSVNTASRRTGNSVKRELFPWTCRRLRLIFGRNEFIK